MRSRSILAVGASLLAAILLLTAIHAPGAGARGLVAPAKVCPNEAGFKHEAKARKSMVCLTNYARHKKGLKRYKVNHLLTRSASTKASDILSCDDFSHTACGRDFTWWMDKYGYTKGAWSAGENIAWSTGSYGASRSIFRAWLTSPGHRHVILSRDYEDLGIGVAHGNLSGAAGVRIWVQHFGRRS